MKTEKKPKKKEAASAQEAVSAENSPGELNEPRWAVITFEKCAAKDLTYPQAEEKLAELAEKKVSGLCIVSNEVAAKL